MRLLSCAFGLELVYLYASVHILHRLHYFSKYQERVIIKFDRWILQYRSMLGTGLGLARTVYWEISQVCGQYQLTDR